MTRQRLHIISVSDGSYVLSQFFEISFVTVATLNLQKFLIYGGKKIRKKTFVSPLLFNRAGGSWHFHCEVNSWRHSAGTVLMAGSSRMLQKGPDGLSAAPVSAALTSSLCLCFSPHPLPRDTIASCPAKTECGAQREPWLSLSGCAEAQNNHGTNPAGLRVLAQLSLSISRQDRVWVMLGIAGFLCAWQKYINLSAMLLFCGQLFMQQFH